MARLRAEVVRDLTREEVLAKRTEIEEELFNLNLKRKTKQAHNPVRVRILRRDLARILTILREDELGMRKLSEGGKLVLDRKEKKE